MAGLKLFTISETNPNDALGGGGCLCSEDKVPDCKGPFIVFHGVDMFSPYSPHCVLGAECACRAAEGVLNGVVLPAVETTAVEELDEEDVPEV